MATNTYVALDKVTVGTATASVTFNSIPQGYTDLILVINGQCSSGGSQNTWLNFNSDTATNYSSTTLAGDGTSAVSTRNSNQTKGGFCALASGVNSTVIYQIQNYSNATTYKTVLGRGNVSNDIVDTRVSLWRKTPEAITSIVVGISGGVNYNVGSTFSLYGIASQETAAKATGGYVTSDANYYYHTFLASGTFTPKQSLTCDYLIVAGGGAGGGTYGGGGGGAGALRTSTGLSVTTTAYAITVGAGGSGSTGAGANGTDSVFNSITSSGGGGGGIFSGGAAKNGGSGGGGSNTLAGGTGTTGGNNGGTGSQATGGYPTGAGGGGASAVGANAVFLSSTGGAGGNGTSSSYSGSSVTYAGGGGGGVDSRAAGATGGAGGSGGGGAGAGTASGSNGTVNLGGGGGGAALGVTGTGGAGGSGIVIVRYAK